MKIILKASPYSRVCKQKFEALKTTRKLFNQITLVGGAPSTVECACCTNNDMTTTCEYFTGRMLYNFSPL